MKQTKAISKEIYNFFLNTVYILKVKKLQAVHYTPPFGRFEASARYASGPYRCLGRTPIDPSC